MATATTLEDGRVLIVGGLRAPDSAELYDPISMSFTPTTAMTGQHGAANTATLLLDGRVLVVGGLPPDQREPADIFDPSTDSWTPTAVPVDDLTVCHSATRLSDGKVLFVGASHEQRVGVLSQDLPTTSAEIFDPASGKFTSVGSMSVARCSATTNLLPDGRVLVAGGGSGPNGASPLASAEIFDPATQKFAVTGSMSVPRTFATSTSLADGRVLIIGGCTSNPIGDDSCPGGSTASAEIFDPATGAFTQTGQMMTGRTSNIAVLLPDGRVLVAGGIGNHSTDDLATGELFDPTTGRFAPTGQMGTAREGAAAALLRDGRVLVVGGTEKDASQSAELYQP
jgi:hypothetical protein